MVVVVLHVVGAGDGGWGNHVGVLAMDGHVAVRRVLDLALITLALLALLALRLGRLRGRVLLVLLVHVGHGHGGHVVHLGHVDGLGNALVHGRWDSHHVHHLGALARVLIGHGVAHCLHGWQMLGHGHGHLMVLLLLLLMLLLLLVLLVLLVLWVRVLMRVLMRVWVLVRVLGAVLVVHNDANVLLLGRWVRAVSSGCADGLVVPANLGGQGLVERRVGLEWLVGHREDAVLAQLEVLLGLVDAVLDLAICLEALVPLDE